MLNVAGLLGACTAFYVFLRLAGQRLVFRICVGPDGIVVGRRRVPYDEVALVRVSPEEGPGKRSDHWVEIHAANGIRRVFLGGEESECARLIFSKCRDGVLVDERGDEHVHGDVADPARALRALLGNRRRTARKSIVVAVGIGIWTVFIVGLMAMSVADGNTPSPMGVAFAATMVLSAVTSAVVAAISARKAIDAGRQIKQAQRRAQA
ncbi:MAG: hypothetical protein ACYS9X_09505 [Planctomycetota bacterium]